MDSSLEEAKVCAKCGESFRKGDPLCHAGAYFCEGENTKHPLDAIIEHAVKVNLDTLVSTRIFTPHSRYVHQQFCHWY